MAGAFGPSKPSSGHAGPMQGGPVSLTGFASKLASLGGKGQGNQSPMQAMQATQAPMQAPKHAAMQAMQAPMQGHAGPSSAPMQALEAIAAKPAPSMHAKQAMQAPPQAPKGKFEPGKKPKPTGPTGHAVINDPKHNATLQQVLDQLEKQNPGKALKAPALVAAWNSLNPDEPMNDARARTVLAKLNKIRDAQVAKQVASYLRAGAKKAVT